MKAALPHMSLSVKLAKDVSPQSMFVIKSINVDQEILQMNKSVVNFRKKLINTRDIH